MYTCEYINKSHKEREELLVSLSKKRNELLTEIKDITSKLEVLDQLVSGDPYVRAKDITYHCQGASRDYRSWVYPKEYSPKQVKHNKSFIPTERLLKIKNSNGKYLYWNEDPSKQWKFYMMYAENCYAPGGMTFIGVVSPKGKKTHIYNPQCFQDINEVYKNYKQRDRI